MASFKHRQPSDTNQSVPETESVPETHSYQEKHFQPTLNEPVVETEQYTEYGATVKPDPTRARSNPTVKSDVTERSDQPGEEDMLAKDRLNRSLQGNSDSGTQYSTPDVGSGVSSGSEGYAHTYGSVGSTSAAASSATATAAATATATSTVAAGAASAVVAGAGAVLIAVTLIIPMVLGVPSAIIFEDIVATDSSIYYSIYFEDYEEGMELYVSLHNNFTDRTHTVESESFSFVERDLKPNMEYTLTVYGSMSAVLKEQVIKTKPSTDVPTFTVNYCDYLPEKGVVSFSSTISGDTAAWGDYRAVLYAEEKDGAAGGMRQIASVMLESVDTEQEIRFQLEKDASYDATFAIECSGQDGTETLYSAPMKVYGSPYFGFNAEFDSATDVLNISSTVYDPDGVRSEYFAIITVTNASNGESYTDSRDLMSGGCEFTNVSHGYTFYDFEVRFQCYEGGQFVDIMDRYFTYSSYSSPAFGNVNYDFVHTSSAATGMYGGTLTITYDLVDHYGQYTELRADLGDKAGSGWAQSLNFDNTMPHEISFDVDEEGCGTVQPLSIWNGDTKLYEGTVSLVCNDSRFSVTTVETAENSTEQTVNKANLDLYADYYDADRAYSDIAYTIVQGSKSVENVSFTPSRNGATRLSFDSSGFVNGAAQLNITYKENGTGKALPAIDVNVYVGPTATIGSYSYDESTSTATVNLTITDQFNAWDNLKAILDRQEITPSGTNSITCNGAPLHNTVTSIVFPLDPAQDGNMLNTPLVFSLWIMGDEEVKVFESSDTMTLPYSHLESYGTDVRDPATGRGIELTLNVSDPMSQWSNYNATVMQGTTQLYSGAVTPGNSVLSFGDAVYENDIATLTVICTSPDGTETLVNEEEIDVYFGPMLSSGNPQYSGTSTDGTVSISVTVTGQFSEQGRIRLYYETPSGVAEVTSNETVPHEDTTYTFNVDGDFLNRTLSLDMVDGSGKHSSSNVLSVTVQYAYISLESPPEPTDPYGASGRGIRLTVYGGGLDGLNIKASVQQGATVLRSDYSVLTGMEIVIPFDDVEFDNGTATLSLSYGNRIPIPFADGTTEMTVQVYYAPAITSVAGGDYSGSGTVTSNITVDDMFGIFNGKYVQLSYMDPDKNTHSIRSTVAYDGQSATFTASFTLPTNDDIVYFLNTDLDVMFVNDGGELVGEEYDGTIRYAYVSFTGYTAEPKDLTQYNMPGISLNLTFAPGSYPDLYNDMHLTIRQGDTTLFDEAWAPGGDIEFYTRDFANGTAIMMLTCNDTFHRDPDCVLINNETIDVYSGPTIDGVTGSYNASTSTGTLTVSVTDTYGQLNGKDGRVAMVSSAVAGGRTSNEHFTSSSGTGTLTFAIESSTSLVNSELTFSFLDAEGGTFLEYAGTVMFRYVELTDYQTSVMDPSVSGPGQSIQLTIAGDSSLYTTYRATIVQEATGCTMYDGDITLLPGDASGVFISSIIFTNTAFDNGEATLTISCMDGISGQRVNVIDGETIQVYCGPNINIVTTSYDGNQGIGTATINYQADFGEWDGYYARIDFYETGKQGHPVESNESIDANGGIITFNLPVSSSMINESLKLFLLDGPGGDTVVIYPGIMFEYTGSTVADIALSYDGAMETGTVNFTIVDTQGAWPDSLVVALVPDSDKIGPGVEAAISKSATSAQFSIATDSPYLNTEMYFVLRGDTEYYRSTAVYTFDYADITGFNWTILEDGPSPAVKGISGTVLVSGPESMLSNYQIQIDQNDITIYPGTSEDRPVGLEMTFSEYAVNGLATVHITATRQGSVVPASYDTTITVYTGLSVNSIDGRGTDNQGTGQILYDITYQGYPAYIEVNVGTQSEDWKRATGSIVDGTGSLTIDLESTRAYNTSLPTRLVYEDGSLISDTTPNVIFKYASMSINTVDPLDPAQGSRGLSAVGVNINDPYSLWTDYRAVVTVNGTGDTLYDGDLVINQEDNTATFVFNNTPFENGYGTLKIYCTADGVEDTEVYSKTVELYNGPTVTVTGSPVLDISAGSSTFSATLYGLFDVFGVVSDDTGTGNMDLIAVIDLNEDRVLSTSFYDVTSHVVTIEFNDGNLANHVGEELTLSIYQVDIGSSGDTPTGDAIASTTIVFTGSGN